MVGKTTKREANRTPNGGVLVEIEGETVTVYDNVTVEQHRNIDGVSDPEVTRQLVVGEEVRAEPNYVTAEVAEKIKSSMGLNPHRLVVGELTVVDLSDDRVTLA